MRRRPDEKNVDHLSRLNSSEIYRELEINKFYAIIIGANNNTEPILTQPLIFHI